MLQLQKNEWEVKVEVADERGFGNDYFVTFGELADRGYVLKVEVKGGWPVKFGSVEWTKAVTAALQVPRPTFKPQVDNSIGADGEGW